MQLNPEEIIQYIVWYATQCGSGLTTVRIVKFLYLVDLYFARETRGKTITGWPWAFVYYGPYCKESYEAIDFCVSKGLITKAVYDSKYEDSDELSVFSCRDEDEPAIGDRLPLPVYGRLQKAIRKWGDDTAGLLDHVYFETEPMIDVQAGDILDFAKAKTVTPVKPVELKKLPQERIDVAKEHVQKLKDKLRTGARRLAEEYRDNAELFDDAYYRAIDYMDGEDLPTGLKGKAKISN